jgi:hypothetical protein
MKLKILSLLFAVGALVSACGDDDDNGTAPENAGRVRVVHLSPNAPLLDVLVDDVTVAENVSYLDVPEYFDVEAGSRNIAVRVSDSDVIAAEEDVTVGDGVDYTVLVGGDFESLVVTPLTDNNTAPSAGDARVRLIHGAPSAGLVDIYVTEPGVDLAGAEPRLTSVEFGDVSPYLTVPAGDYQVRITPSFSETVLIDSGTLTLSPGQVRTGIAVDAEGGGEPYGAFILEDLN